MPDMDIETIDGEPVSEKHIFKEPIVCHLVIQRMKDDGSRYVYTISLITGWEEDCYAEDIDDNDDVIGVVPTMPGSYRVSGVDINHDYAPLGNEYIGVDHPDWVGELLRHRRVEMDYARRYEESKDKQEDQ